MQLQSISPSAAGRMSRRHMAWIALALCAIAAVAIIALASPSNDETELFFKKLANRFKKAASKLSKGQEAKNLKNEIAAETQAISKQGLQEQALTGSVEGLQEQQVRECRACQHLIC
jgi:hypothetical protein